MDGEIYEGTTIKRMTPEEVADTLAKELGKTKYSELWVALNEAIKYTEKSIPKMPITKQIIDSIGFTTGIFAVVPYCPTCENKLGIDCYEDGYVCCWECGQAIDWETWHKEYGRYI